MRIKKYPFRPFLRFVVDGEEGGGAPAPKPAPPKTDEVSEGGDLGFPANTPVKEMTAEQQAAYWKDKARKHEKNRKPENFDSLVAELEELRAAKQAAEDAGKPAEQLEVEQKIAAAVADAVARTKMEALPGQLRSELKSRAPHLSDEELDAQIAIVNVSALAPNGVIDAERVDTWAKPFVQKKESEEPGQPAWTLGHILNGTQELKKGSSESLAEAEARTLAKYQKKS